MYQLKVKGLRSSDRDLDFLVETASPKVKDKPRLKQIIREESYRLFSSLFPSFS